MPDVLEHVAMRLKNCGKKLITVESLTGGLIAEMFTRIPGSSEFFWGSFVSYAIEAKHTMLSIPYEFIQLHNVVSIPVAEAMARNALVNTQRGTSSPSYAIAVTGLAGPSGASEGIPIGTVCIACGGYVKDSSIKVVSEVCYFKGDRLQIRLESCNQGCRLLLSLLDIIEG